MKKLVLVFGFFFFASIVFSSLFLVRCKSDPINALDNISPLPDTLSNVSGYINSLDGPVEDAQITLNNKTTYSDSNGFFQFKDCIKNDLVLTITHPEFSKYSNSISVTDSLYLDISLTRIKYDYFPLKVGNHWTYHWTNGWYASGGGGGSSTGKIDWVVTSKSGSYPNWIYSLKETFLDSTNNSLTARFFNLITNSSDSIECVGNNYLIRMTTRRLYDITFGNIVYQFLPYDNYTLKLEKNIGVIQCYYGYGGITFGYSTNIEIIGYSLN